MQRQSQQNRNRNRQQLQIPRGMLPEIGRVRPGMLSVLGAAETAARNPCRCGVTEPSSGSRFATGFMGAFLA